MTQPVVPPGTDLVLRSARGRIALIATVAASGMASLDATVVNVALPHIGRDLSADITALQWILTGYLLALATLILLGCALGDRFGRRRVFLIGTIWFALASLLCGAAPTIGNVGGRAPPAGNRGRVADTGEPCHIAGKFSAGGSRRRSRRVVRVRRGGRCHRAPCQLVVLRRHLGTPLPLHSLHSRLIARNIQQKGRLGGRDWPTERHSEDGYCW